MATSGFQLDLLFRPACPTFRRSDYFELVSVVDGNLVGNIPQNVGFRPCLHKGRESAQIQEEKHLKNSNIDTLSEYWN